MIVCDFAGSRPLGAPSGWDQQLDGGCATLPIVDAVDELSGFNFMYSVWRPTPDELAALAAGGAIRLGIMGTAHPVVNMAVLTAGTCQEVELREVAEL
ncbi:hypothetical protein [Sphingobium sp. LSP13-1-1.1]|uniref:hypothetical protein n=1 Tax=Sphingobium sp. LSP13-1-1.1 TaxID=3135234 RepID=UPI00343571B4